MGLNEQISGGSPSTLRPGTGLLPLSPRSSKHVLSLQFFRLKRHQQFYISSKPLLGIMVGSSIDEAQHFLDFGCVPTARAYYAASPNVPWVAGLLIEARPCRRCTSTEPGGEGPRMSWIRERLFFASPSSPVSDLEPARTLPRAVDFARASLFPFNIELLSQLSECSIAFDRRKRHLCFEDRCVVPAWSSAHGLS
jgi:hypothetical protein